MRTPMRRRVARLLLVVAAVSAGAFAITQRDAVRDAVAECGRLDGATLTVAALLSLLGVVNRGLQTRRAYAGAGLHIDRLPATAVTATAFSANKVVKSGGIVGVFAHLRDSRRRSLDSTRTVAAYVVISLSAGVGAIVLGAAIVALASVPSFVALLCLGAVGYWLSGRTSGWAFPRTFVASRARGMAGRLSTGRLSRTVDVDDVEAACRSIVRARDHLAWVVAHAVVTKLVGALLLFVVLHGFDVTNVSVETTVRLYALTFIASMLGPLPAGLGTTEASLAGLLVAADVDGSTAIAVAMAFRFFDLWLPIAVGAITAPFVLRRAPRAVNADVGPAAAVATRRAEELAAGA